MEKNPNKVRDSKNAKRYWTIFTDSKDAIQIIKRIFKEDVAQETNGGYDKKYSIMMRTACWRRNEIVDILGLKRIKEVRQNKGWILNL